MTPLTFANIDHLCAGVDLNADMPLIDLRGYDFIEPFAVVYLGMFLRYYEHRVPNLGVWINPGPLQSYLSNQNFWQRFHFDPRSLTPAMRVRLRTTTSLNDIIDIEKRPGIGDEVADASLDVLGRRNVRVPLEPIAEIVGELVDNFALHAEEHLAAFLLQDYPALKRFVLAIGDCGIGIRRSLTQNPKHAHLAEASHARVARHAFRAGVGRRTEGGLGLWHTRDIVLQLGGTITLATGNGYVRISEQAGVRIGYMGFDMRGVQIQITIPHGAKGT